MGIISWIVMGGLAGWIASLITGKSKQMGFWMNILIGIAGAFIGGFIMNLIGQYSFTGFNIWSLLVAIGGSVILLLVINLFKKAKK